MIEVKELQVSCLMISNELVKVKYVTYKLLKHRREEVRMNIHFFPFCSSWRLGNVLIISFFERLTLPASKFLPSYVYVVFQAKKVNVTIFST